MMQSIRITDRAHLDRLAENMAAVIRAIERGAYAVEVGVDPLDNGAKFKVDNGPWCPPICGQVRPSPQTAPPRTMGAGNVADDDRESLVFADESDYVDDDQDVPGFGRADDQDRPPHSSALL